MENRVIEDYIILTYRSSLELRNDVLEKISEGYIPCGGVSLANGTGYPGDTQYGQAMIKYSKD